MKEYYGETLSTSDDLQTNACCTGSAIPDVIRTKLSNVHPDTIARYYGCGLCLPDYDLTGLNVLDLGCGAGRDVYIASQLVGPTGSVVGIDMTDEQLHAAKDKQGYHAEKFGYSNVEFVQGYLESMHEVLNGRTFDLIISNCVLNLCTDKPAVLSHCYNLLNENGEFYFSDVYASRRIPQMLQEDPILYGECLSGALYWNDFQNLAKQAGFADPRLVEDAPITIQNASVQEKCGTIDFYSATYRLWKNARLEPDCEDYGQAVIYKGGLSPHRWRLDKGHVFTTGKVHPVCGNTYLMLQANPNIAQHFDFIGDFSTHYGIFEGCGAPEGVPFDVNGLSTKGGSSAAACC